MYFRIAAVLLGLGAARAPSPIEPDEAHSASQVHRNVMRDYGPMWDRGENLDDLSDYLGTLLFRLESMDPASSMDEIWDSIGGQAIIESIGEFPGGHVQEAMEVITYRLLTHMEWGRNPMEFAIWLRHKLGSLRGAPWKVKILNDMLRSASMSPPAREINWDKAGKINELIAGERKERSIHSLHDCIPSRVMDIQIKNQPGRTWLNSWRGVTVDGAVYTARLVQFWYLAELRRIASGFVGGPIIELESDVEECEKRVDFAPLSHRGIEKYSLLSQLTPQRVLNVINSEIPDIVKAIRGFHEMGLLVDFENLGFVHVSGRNSEGTSRLEIVGPFELRMFVNAHTRQLLSQEGCRGPASCSRMGDMIKLFTILNALNLDIVVKGWHETLSRLPVGGEVPDYGAWLAAFNGQTSIREPSEILRLALDSSDPLAICPWTSFIGASQTCDSPDIDERWACLNGPVMLEFVRRTKHSAACSGLLVDEVTHRIGRASEASGVVQFGLWLHAQLIDWKDLGLCDRLKHANSIPFWYIVCPEELLGETQIDQPVGFDERWSSKPPQKADVERLWSLLRMRELAEENQASMDGGEAALKVAKFLFEISTSDEERPILEGLAEVCSSQNEALLMLAMNSPQWLAFASECLEKDIDHVRSIARSMASSRMRKIARQKMTRVANSIGNGRLVVRRPSAFSDSIPLLTSEFVASNKPRGIKFEGEGGIDAGGLTREWFSVVGELVARRCDNDPLSGLFTQHDEGDGYSFGVVNRDRIQTEQDLKAWYAFGRLMALTIIKHEQIAIELPVYFYARFLKGRVDSLDLKPELEGRMNMYRKIAAYPPEMFGVTERDPEGIAIPLTFPELGDDEVHVTYANKEEVVSRAIASYSVGPDEPAFEQMRAGFSVLLDLGHISERVSAPDFKRLISGNDILDVARLKAIARKSNNVRTQCFDWLFEWLADAPLVSQRRFMLFVTGSASFSPRAIVVNPRLVKDPAFPGFPQSHTCSLTIDLPDYASKAALVAAIEKAVMLGGYQND